ncbi:hypothetical protein ISN45_At01g037810 [Arabidopsis thaliana x Arabidopsis arenosa]|uniref:Uncharacterized protein n=2 Tax=Arabidopsis TaxID=3701 RepID=A0A178W9E3_ARATH|nr:hypothetical protein ISN45_At01g037810 [Arabidopsis thaliana x Arabidopsis arenosa]OAP15037.1 hypothetical protein AXX17_AT1G39760 [Arabidopsis thaliana]
MTNNNPAPLLGFRIAHLLEQEPDTKDLTINVKTEILKHEFGPIKSSFSFSPHNFFEEDVKKQELYFFLIAVGIEEDDAKLMMTDMIFYVLGNIDELRGVLTLLLKVQFPSFEPIEEH